MIYMYKYQLNCYFWSPVMEEYSNIINPGLYVHKISFQMSYNTVIVCNIEFLAIFGLWPNLPF